MITSNYSLKRKSTVTLPLFFPLGQNNTKLIKREREGSGWEKERDREGSGWERGRDRDRGG